MEVHQSDLSSVMTIYSTASGRIHRARTRLTSVRQSLVACKELLHYKRDELKKLWLEGVEQKHVLQLLQQIETMKVRMMMIMMLMMMMMILMIMMMILMMS